MEERNWRVLIVEDDYFIATDLAKALAGGMTIVGPVPSLARALALVKNDPIDGAVLDVNLDGEKVYEVADALIARGIPVMFVTGYDRASLPARYADVPLCVKPVEGAKVVEMLTGILAS